MRLPPSLAAMLCAASLLTVRAADKPVEKPAKDAAGHADGGKAKDDKDIGRKPRSRINKDGKEIRVCNLRMCWWSQPEKAPELALQLETTRLPVSPDVLYFSNPFEYEGEPTVVILRRIANGGVDKKGNPIETWEPYASFKLRPADDDIAVVLFEVPGKPAAQVRLFDFSTEAFPLGSMRIVNFTRSKVIAALAGNPFAIEPGASMRAPKTFTQRTRAHFAVAVQEQDGNQTMLDSSTLIFQPNVRAMTFVIEKPGADPSERFHVQSIIDTVVAPIVRQPVIVQPDPGVGRPSSSGKSPEASAAAKKNP